MDELLPCPFCGASASGHAIAPHTHVFSFPDGTKMPDHEGSYVIEGDCQCGSGLIGDTQEEVTARWNQREVSNGEAAAMLGRYIDAYDANPSINYIRLSREESAQLLAALAEGDALRLGLRLHRELRAAAALTSQEPQ